VDSPDLIPTMVDATPCSEADAPSLYAMVRQLAASADIPAPAIFIVDSLECNAFASGLAPASASVTVTTALLERLELRELRAVVAHEIGHIVHNDIAEATHLAHEAASCCGVERVAALAGKFADRTARGALVDDWVALGSRRILGAEIQRRAVATISAFSRQRERHADEFAVRAGSGPWLASALLKMDAAVAPPLDHRLPDWCRILLLTDHHAAFRTHPPTMERIAAIPPFSFDRLAQPSCPTCAATLIGDGDCEHCGSPRRSRPCGCGATLRPEDRFCHACGVALSGGNCRRCRRPAGPESDCAVCGFPLP